MPIVNNNDSWEFFTLDELKCKCGICKSTGLEMNNEFMRKLISCRRIVDFAFTVNSAYRCPYHNNLISLTGKNGPHTTGRAIDIGCTSEEAYKILKAAFNIGFTGIGVNQKNTWGHYIHLDDLKIPDYPRPAMWSY